MAAQVLHYGNDSCNRTLVLRALGYDIRTAPTLGALRLHLVTKPVDVVVVTEEDAERAECAGRVIRKGGATPSILFCYSPRSIQPGLYDRVHHILVPPDRWVSDIAGLIAQGRSLIEESMRLRNESEKLIGDAERIVRQCKLQLKDIQTNAEKQGRASGFLSKNERKM